MKETVYAEIICKGFCKFYKEGKEEIQCGGYKLLKNNLTCAELIQLADNISKQTNPEESENFLTQFICNKCDFQIDGCDFREGLPSPPCGGYIIISRLISYFRKLENQT